MSESVLDELQNGITDIKIDRPGPESEVHLLHRVGTMPMKALDRAVTLLRAANDQISTSTIETIDPRFVLTHAWSFGRFEESKKLILQNFEKDTRQFPVFTLPISSDCHHTI